MTRQGIFLFLVVLLFALPVAAQEGSGCDINLVDTITALLEAQRLADQGDTFKSVQAIEAVRAQLDTVLAGCENVGVKLGQTFTSADGLFTFSYPEGWAMLSPQAGAFALANTQKVLNAALQSNLDSPLESGAQVIAILTSDMNQLSSGADSFDEFVDNFRRQGISSDYTLSGPLSAPTTINDYEVKAFALQNGPMRGTLYILNLGADNQVAVALGIAPGDEFDAFEPVLTAVVKSIRYGSVPRSTGKSLDEITYTRAVSIRDLIEDVDFRNAVLAPDGTAVAWYGHEGDGQICLFTFADTSTVCTPLPQNARGVPPVLLWSPDSQYIAFTSDFVRLFIDADIWLFDRANQRVTDRTDDGINRWRALRGVGEGDSPGPLWIDNVFTWGPDNNLYFIRQDAPDPSKLLEGTTGLYRIAPDGDRAELIRDLTGVIDPISVYFFQVFSLNGPMAVSPDGKNIAFIVMTNKLDATINGIWTMALSGKQAPKQVLAASNLTQGLQSGLPEDIFVFPMGIAWSQDGSGLFVFGGNPTFSFPLWMMYHVDLGTGNVIAMTDFSSLSQKEMFTIDPATGLTPTYDYPRAAVLSPDGTTPIVFNSERNIKAGISALRLVDGEVQPTQLFQFDDYVVVPSTMASAASDGKVLIYGYLFMPQE